MDYVWDEAGMMTKSYSGSVSTPTAASEYIYGPDDERLAVHDAVHGTWTWDVRGSDGKVLRELASDDSGASKGVANWSWKKDYVYRDGLLLASVSASGTYHYHLGTLRLIPDAAGARVAEHDYYPFGAEVALPGASETPQERMKFTGHERDVIPGDNHTLDYMHARYYNASLGRFLSVDPSKVGMSRGKPQSFNRFVYAEDNPERLVDRNGMWSTEIHNAIIQGAFARLVPHQLTVLQTASARVDGYLNGGQTADLAYKHGMRAPFESPRNRPGERGRFHR